MPQELIATLEEAKSKAVEISQKLAEASATASQIEEARAKYKPAALRGAVLFFVLASLAAISNMYEYSLASFLAVFSLTLDTSKKVQGCHTHLLLSGLALCCTARNCRQPNWHVHQGSNSQISYLLLLSHRSCNVSRLICHVLHHQDNLTLMCQVWVILFWSYPQQCPKFLCCAGTQP